MRISTTVDAIQWERARKLMDSPASKIVDRALETLVERLEAEQDLKALEEFPYEGDPELNWEVDPVPGLPYDGKVPQEILRLAAQRRRSKRR